MRDDVESGCSGVGRVAALEDNNVVVVVVAVERDAS